ncbi:MAG TPA: hypothetical protein VES02_14525 [Dermatophilaceae bacterium]|nr:hypothetical protein [Dermatophilaceae bacterium]
MSTLSKDLRHSRGTHCGGDNDRAPALLAAAKMRDRTTAPVALMGTDQSALEQGGEDLA